MRLFCFCLDREEGERDIVADEGGNTNSNTYTSE